VVHDPRPYSCHGYGVHAGWNLRRQTQRCIRCALDKGDLASYYLRLYRYDNVRMSFGVRIFPGMGCRMENSPNCASLALWNARVYVWRFSLGLCN
jgi:hypothetical protein